MKNEKRKELYSREFKLKFMGYGEWLDEPDEVTFEYKGIKCLVFRVVKREIYCPTEAYFGGHLCGYILLPPEHPMCGKECWDEFECHQGVTFHDGTDEVWILGFDCGHLGDLIPTMEHMHRTIPELIEINKAFSTPEGFEKHPWFHPTYKNVDFCIKECKSLAKQAAKMMVPA